MKTERSCVNCTNDWLLSRPAASRWRGRAWRSFETTQSSSTLLLSRKLLCRWDSAPRNEKPNLATICSESLHTAPMIQTVSDASLFQHAHAHSSGFFITQDSSFGNLILPVLPRLEPESWPLRATGLPSRCTPVVRRALAQNRAVSPSFLFLHFWLINDSLSRCTQSLGEREYVSYILQTNELTSEFGRAFRRVGRRSWVAVKHPVKQSRDCRLTHRNSTSFPVLSSITALRTPSDAHPVRLLLL